MPQHYPEIQLSSVKQCNSIVMKYISIVMTYLLHRIYGCSQVLAWIVYTNRVFNIFYPAEGYGIKYEGSFLEKSQSGCVQNFCHFVCLHHFWA